MGLRTPGILIAIEGIDGSGKTTLMSLVKEYLIKKGVHVFALPSGGLNSYEIEAQLRKIVVAENNGMVKNTEIFLYFAALSQKIGEHILPSLKKYDVVIVDRFILSTFIFTYYVYKQNRALMNSILEFASQGITPDYTLLCDLEESVAYSRLINRGEKLSKREKQGIPLMKIMRKGFLEEVPNMSKHYKIIRTDQIPIENMGECINELYEYIFSRKKE